MYTVIGRESGSKGVFSKNKGTTRGTRNISTNEIKAIAGGIERLKYRSVEERYG